MRKNLLTIGLSPYILEALTEEDEIDVYAIEEENFYVGRKLDKYKNPLLKRVIISKYIDSDECVEDALKLHSQIELHGVLPVRDYAVAAAGKIAETLNLRGIGYMNSKILTNKYLLREACLEHNIPHPQFAKINSIEELKNFYQGKSLIFKPATLQASQGISKIDSLNDIESAWNNTTSTYELPSKTVPRPIFRENLAEEYVEGIEVSVETLIENGTVIFDNITMKTIFKQSFVEKGHTVPAKLKRNTELKILDAKHDFIKKLRIKNGVLHSEWKIADNVGSTPILIECAGRLPGDNIDELIEISYGFNLTKVLCYILSGKALSINCTPERTSAIRYFSPTPGKLKEIRGLEILKDPHVMRYEILVKPGDQIPEPRSSWDRIGYFIVKADESKQAEELCDKILKEVQFIVSDQ